MDEDIDSQEREDLILDYFLEIGHLLPTIESAVALFSIFKTFKSLSDVHNRKISKIYYYNIYF